MPIIEADGLSKTYRVYQKEKGLLGALRGLIHREYKEVKAVENVHFTIEPGEIVGFLGATPGEYFVDAQILPGAVFDLWVIRPDFRNRALGLLLMRAIEEEFDTTCCLGVNPGVVRFYTNRGYGYQERLNRYVAVLDPRRFQMMLAGAPGEPLRLPPSGRRHKCDPVRLGQSEGRGQAMHGGAVGRPARTALKVGYAMHAL